MFTSWANSLKEWHDVVMKETALQLIARMTSRAFLGPELCRDPKWLRIATQYTLSTFHAGHQLRPWPYHLRKIVQWFLPECRTAREMVAEGHKLIGPLIQQRRAAKAAAQAEGKPIPVYNDAIEWCEQEAKGQFYDPVNIQLLLSVNSISTTSDTLNQIVLDLAQHPEFFEPLRKEVADALNEGGWQKTTLYKMKLLDSFIKESQRLKPINSGE
jgi:cytochrome P450